MLGGMKLDDAVNALNLLGLGTDDLIDKLVKLKYPIEKAEEAVGKLGTSGSKLENLKNTVVGMVKAFISSPTAIGLTVAAVATAVVAYQAWSTSYEHLADKAKEAKAAVESTSSELDQMNSKYETSAARIEELIALGEERTAAEDEELTALQLQNDLLEVQIALKKQLLEQQQLQAASDAAAPKKYRETIESFGVWVFKYLFR